MTSYQKQLVSTDLNQYISGRNQFLPQSFQNNKSVTIIWSTEITSWG